MPRYYFHSHDEIDAPDEEGQELRDVHAAVALATSFARELAAEHVREGGLTLSHFIAVTDEAGANLAKVTFGDVVRIRE
jgi:hypothetical protein